MAGGARVLNRPIFVFGSNLAGRHGAGAALFARKWCGARYGQGEGLQGRSYAIPTKDARLRTLPLPAIAEAVGRFISHAAATPDVTYQLTPIGCGLAGYRRADIEPLFASAPGNVIPPPEWAFT